jgi:anti-anti-sigma regulatory factor/HAMP domain-containing protein
MKQSLEKLNLGAKVNLIVITVLAILLIAIAVLVNISIRNLTIATGQHRTEQETEMVQSRFYEAEQEVLAATKLLATRAGIIEAVAEGNKSKAKTAVLIGAAPLDFDDIGIADVGGVRLVAVVDEESGTFNIAQKDALLSLALIGIETTGAIAKGEGAGLGMAAAVPLRDASGAIVGALLASRKVDDEFLAEINSSREDVHLTLIHEGQILAHSWTEENHISTVEEPVFAVLLDQSVIGQALSGQTVVAKDLVSIGGAPYALAHIPLTVGGETNAVIGYLFDLSELAAFQGRLTINLGIVSTLLALVAIGALTLFVRQSVAIPLRNLELVAEQMADGDYQKRAEVTTMDETGRLAYAFNAMASAVQEREAQLVQAREEVEKQVEERTAELRREVAERERAQEESARLQQEVIEAQKQTLRELSTPIIPVMEHVIVMTLIGRIDSARARDITRALLAGIREHRAKVVILDITGVPLVDTGVADYLNKTIQAARLKGARTIITGISDAVAETVVDLGIDWTDIETVSNLQAGLRAALASMGLRIG